MNIRFPLATLVIAVMLPSAVAAQVVTDGKSLRQRCATVQWTSPSAGLACRGYIGAVADILTDGNKVYGQRACPPPGAKREALVKAVRDWLGRHPDLLQQKASVVTAQALAEMYPCEN
ncbi:MAG: Rap1a/Tai family immunity protein [Rhodospirillales bacterium]|nr:Rap1a/Tai family immunity protein [Rhodospirillales bacterium]MDH3910545.1 Rap1a/Tai family immunity protein [Rhodospirillales bacterium]MDH3917507.1 Rap1a/Tai family immunity protein [Rhodospirillales bacterium]MDH3967106.1 Rap1a/Tai family immunity protein [Rhodospirillales bacterium]